MSDRPLREAGGRDDEFLREGGLRAPPGLSTLGKLWWWFHFLILVKIARLRFVAVLATIGLAIVYWDTLKAYYDRWTRPADGMAAASSNSEWFCPMHPQVVRDNSKDKCPICFMPLSKRAKGSGVAEALHAGVVTRVQLSPYRVALAGVNTTEVAYRPLVKEISTVGFVEFDERRQAQIAARVKGRIEKLFINVTGQMVRAGEPLASIYSPDLIVTVENLLDAKRSGSADLLRIARERLRLWDISDKQVDEIIATGKADTHLMIRSPISGHVIRKYQVEGRYVDEGMPLYEVADLSVVWIQAQVYENELAFLKEGLSANATTAAFPNREFKGKLTFVHPHLDLNSRTLTVRFDVENPDHLLRPGMYANVRLDIPIASMEGMGIPKDGNVLAVPESAVIDTGREKIVYRESAPNVYEGVEVKLGPRGNGGFYPVVAGLKVGERIATAGSFLIDAETRLNPAAGSIYFGGSGGGGSKTGGSVVAATRPSALPDEDAEIKAARQALSPDDRLLVDQQDFCAVLSMNRLGSMGKPVKVMIKDQPVFLCCKGCEGAAKSKADEILAKVAKLKAKEPIAAASTSAEDKEVLESRKSLNPEDRRLVDAQEFCAVETNSRLGSMGPPIKIIVDGKPVFLCCEGCEEEARKHPKETLKAVEDLKARAPKVAKPHEHH